MSRLNQRWEEVLEEYCDVSVCSDYRSLTPSGKETMLAALREAVCGQMETRKDVCKLAKARAKASKAMMPTKGKVKGSNLLSALQASGADLGFADEETMRRLQHEFLGSWGKATSVKALLQQHSKASFRRGQLNMTLPYTSNVTVKKQSGASAWEHLTSVPISKLRLFDVMSGRRLDCEVVSMPALWAGIYVVVQDAQRSAVLCCVYNLPGVRDQAAAEAALPKGSRLSVAEPFLKILKDGQRAVRIDNPDQLQIFLPGDPVLRKDGGIAPSDPRREAREAQVAEQHPVSSSALFEDGLVVGTRVQMHGLTSKKGMELNGKFGTVLEQDCADDAERLLIEVASSTGKGETVKLRPRNLLVAPDVCLGEALQVKLSANEAFESGDLEKAVGDYDQAISLLSALSTDAAAVSETSKCFCNRALCYLHRKDWTAALQDAKAALQREPASVKAHFYSAQALFRDGLASNQDDVALAVRHVCCAIALGGRLFKPSSATLRHMSDLRESLAKISEASVPECAEIRCIVDSPGLSTALHDDSAKFLVAVPGTYNLSGSETEVRHDVDLVGLGMPTLCKGFWHAIAVFAGHVHIDGFTVKDGSAEYTPQFAALAVGGRTARLTLVNCSLQDMCVGGVVVDAGARAFVKHCRFHSLPHTAIEVRAQGELSVSSSEFCKVQSAISAFSGAKLLKVDSIVVDRASETGIVAAGGHTSLKVEERLHAMLEEHFDHGTPGFDAQADVGRFCRSVGLQGAFEAHENDWNGRLVVELSDTVIRNTRGAGCIFDGCAAMAKRCEFEGSVRHVSATTGIGHGAAAMNEADVVFRSCLFTGNEQGLTVVSNRAGSIAVENCAFARNKQDIVEDAGKSTSSTLPFEVVKGLPCDLSDMFVQGAQLHKELGGWSVPVSQTGNRFLGRSGKVPTVVELDQCADLPMPSLRLPQKLAWEAAGRGKFNLQSPCGCGFDSTELGNSSECSLSCFNNHIDFPPFMCLPASRALADKQDDPNEQFYFRQCAGAPSEPSRRDPSRHWCLLGEIMAVKEARGADAASFAISAGEDAAKCIELRTRFADQSSTTPDVEALVMMEHAPTQGSSSWAVGRTLALLYAEAIDIDITRGTGKVAVVDSGCAFIFDASLKHVLAAAEHCRGAGGPPSAVCASCGRSGELQLCSLCGVLGYCSKKCSSKHAAAHSLLCPQMQMLSRLARASFRSYDAAFSFTAWAGDVEQAGAQGGSGPSDAQVHAGCNFPAEAPGPAALHGSVDSLCSLLDSCRDTKEALEQAIGVVNEALQAKRPDGSSSITRALGRQKLQNKLKRAKAALDQSADGRQPQSASPASLTDQGEVDMDGYHGTQSLLSLPSRPSHVFFVLAGAFASAPGVCCTELKPHEYCSDFTEIKGSFGGARCFTCWGHSSSRPGQRLPSQGQRLWKLRPSDIHFSQDSVGKNFTNGNTLQDTLQKLRTGECKIEDIQKIQITWHSHVKTSPGRPRWWTYTGNRRLRLFQLLESEGKLDSLVVEVVNHPVPEWRMTTPDAESVPWVRGKALR